MAKKVTIELVDDLDGKEITDGAGETVSFSLNGTAYEIDLSSKNADKLRGQLEVYVAVARKIGRKGAAVGSKKSTDGPTASQIRDWARSNGMSVPDRGRVPADVREAFESAK